MDTKKEVLEFLRNKQKAAEIDSKVDGVNLWVLLGAIGFIFWELAGSVNSPVWADHALVLHVLILAQSVYLINIFSTFQIGLSEDVRYSPGNYALSATPVLQLLGVLLLVMPPAIFYLFVQKTLAASGLLTAWLLLTFGIVLSFRHYFSDNLFQVVKFPELDIAPSRKTGFIIQFLIIILLMMIAVDQGREVLMKAPWRTADHVRSLGLAAVLYVLILVTLRRKALHENLQWTYDLETELLLGFVSPDAALRRLENRAFGPRLQGVLDKISTDIEEEILSFEVLVDESEKKLAGLEPKARISSILETIGPAIASQKRLFSEMTNLLNYLKKLKDKTALMRPGTKTVLKNVIERLDADIQRMDITWLKLTDLMRTDTAV